VVSGIFLGADDERRRFTLERRSRPRCGTVASVETAESLLRRRLPCDRDS
jgi:hypothetical protein